MLSELPDHVFDIVFVNQDISFHDRDRGFPAFHTVKDRLLILEGYLGIRNQERWNECMRGSTLLTPYPLNGKE